MTTVATRPAAPNATRSSPQDGMVFRRRTKIAATGEYVEAGTPLSAVAKKPWCTEQWKRDADQCKLIGEPIPTDDQE